LLREPLGENAQGDRLAGAGFTPQGPRREGQRRPDVPRKRHD
jgi:hypothetical protein